ncbi:MAG TPA: hypothetical protein VFZ53_03125, partial [Polyangiaceae bacterium]
MSGSAEAGPPQTEGGPATPTDAESDGSSAPIPAAPEAGAPAPADEPVVAPPEPLEDETAERDALITHGARSLALATLLGAAIATWTQLAFRSPWLDELIIDNALGPELRKRLLVALVLGGVFGAAGGAGAVVWVRRRGLRVELVEQWLWFLSPLVLLPLAPMLFRAKAWIGRHAELLPIVALVALALEFLASRSLANAP